MPSSPRPRGSGGWASDTPARAAPGAATDPSTRLGPAAPCAGPIQHDGQMAGTTPVPARRSRRPRADSTRRSSRSPSRRRYAAACGDGGQRKKSPDGRGPRATQAASRERKEAAIARSASTPARHETSGGGPRRPGAGRPLSPAAPAPSAGVGTARGSGARGLWRPCDPTLAEAGFECARLGFPGTADPTGRCHRGHALVRHRATGTAAQRIGSLIFNPRHRVGGPGGLGPGAPVGAGAVRPRVLGPPRRGRVRPVADRGPVPQPVSAATGHGLGDWPG